MIIATVIVLLVAVAMYIFLQQPQFGTVAKGELLKKILRSQYYKNNQFQNMNPTPQFTDGASVPKVMKQFFFERNPRNKPSEPLPTAKHNIKDLPANENLLVWFGHSSYLLQVDGKRFLVDPVMSGHASPVKFTTPAFAGTDVYNTNDLPHIDFLVLTHDHYDHLDYQTIKEVRSKVGHVITGLGTGSHLLRWGYSPSIITELDWNEEHQLENGFTLHTTTARHFSGRSFKRNSSLWLAMLLTTPSKKIYIGGDSGYDVHFKSIGEKVGSIDLAILENGQYNRYWKHIHMMPEEVVQAAIDLRAKKLLPVHWGKFALAMHAWDEPIKRVVKEAGRKEIELLHPMIGDVLNLDAPAVQERWWEQVK